MTDIRHIDLCNYSLAELRLLSADVARKMSAIEQTMMDNARRRIEQIALEVGMPLEELLAKPRKGRSPATIYVNPDDDTQIWTGRGRKPAWLAAWLECGITLEELRRQDVPATR